MVIASRVSRPPQNDVVDVRNLDFASEEGLQRVWQFGKQKLGERLRQGL